MAYEPKNWLDGQTVIEAADMTRIEQTLADAVARIEALEQGREDGGDLGPQYPPGEGFVGQVAEASPYTAMRVTAIDDAYDMVGFDITHTGGGKTRTVRLQGPYIEGTDAVDAYQRIEEVFLGDYLAVPRSNLEFAFQLTVGGVTDFVPYHGTAKTAIARPVEYRDLDGTVLDLNALSYGQALAPRGLVVDQSVYARHRQTGTQNLVRIDTVHTFYPDGMIEVQGRWESLVPVTVGAVYAPMTPYQQADMTRLQHEGGTVALDTTPPGSTMNVALPDTVTSGLLTASSRPGVQIAFAWTDPVGTLRQTRPDRKSTPPIIFVQRRTDGINKVYPHAWNLGSQVDAGEVWTFGAQWRIQDTR